VSYDPKYLVALLGFLAVVVVLSLIVRSVRRRHGKPEEASAPSLLSPAPPVARLQADYDKSRANVERPGVKTIAIIHDFDNPDGLAPGERDCLSVREAFEILAEIRSVDENTPIEIILHTPGGDAFAARLIANALKSRPNTRAFVPYCAMSAGTMIALATNQVVMGKYACLGPIDLQYGPFPVDSFQRLMKEKPIQDIEDYFILISYRAEKELRNARALACELMNKHHFGPDDACQLTNFLISGDMPHSEQIGRVRAKELGVNVAAEDCPEAVYRLVERRLELLRGLQSQSQRGTFEVDEKSGAKPASPKG
jgi:hypothetical protein